MSTQKQFYNSTNPQYLDAEKNKPYARHLVSRLQSAIPGAKSVSVLEIGAGQGRFTFELAKRVHDVMATDLSEKQIALLKDKIVAYEKNGTRRKQQAKKPSRTISCQVLDVLKDPPDECKQDSYDCIVGFFMLHHIDRKLYPKMLHHLLPLLKKGGLLVFIEPNPLYPFHLVEMMIEPDMHWEIEKQIYSNYLGVFQNAARDTGCAVKKFERFGFFPPPLINAFPFVTKLEKGIEKIPLIAQFLTPFVLIKLEASK